MSIELCILASGSSGNASVLRTNKGCILIDCGIGPKTTAKRLKGTGVTLKEISAIILTHLDSDHCNPNWSNTIQKLGITVYCHTSRLRDVAHLTREAREFGRTSFSPLPDLSCTPVSLAHDSTGSHGFVIECDSARLGYATDLGHVPASLFEGFIDLDILALESNYDVQMQLTSSRPYFLKQRIMGGAGHLSNDQALAAVQHIFDRAQQTQKRIPRHVVLLHRSRECNCPKLLQKVFSKDKRIASRLTLAHAFERSEWLATGPARPRIGHQLTIGWSQTERTSGPAPSR